MDKEDFTRSPLLQVQLTRRITKSYVYSHTDQEPKRNPSSKEAKMEALCEQRFWVLQISAEKHPRRLQLSKTDTHTVKPPMTT